MKYIYILSAASFLIANLFSSCAENTDVISPAGNEEETFEILGVTDLGFGYSGETRSVMGEENEDGTCFVGVIDGSLSTRATLNGLKTTFSSGDAIGLTFFKDDGTIITNNVKCTFNGTKWIPETTPKLSGATKYIATFPFNTMYNGKTTPDEVRTAVPVLNDQSTKVNFMASDVMAEVGTVSSYKLNINLSHLRACISASMFSGYIYFNGAPVNALKCISVRDKSLQGNNEAFQIYDTFAKYSDDKSLNPYNHESGSAVVIVEPGTHSPKMAIGDTRYGWNEKCHMLFKDINFQAGQMCHFECIQGVSYGIDNVKTSDLVWVDTNKKEMWISPREENYKYYNLRTLGDLKLAAIVTTVGDENGKKAFYCMPIDMVVTYTGTLADYESHFKVDALPAEYQTSDAKITEWFANNMRRSTYSDMRDMAIQVWNHMTSSHPFNCGIPGMSTLFLPFKTYVGCNDKADNGGWFTPGFPRAVINISEYPDCGFFDKTSVKYLTCGYWWNYWGKQDPIYPNKYTPVIKFCGLSFHQDNGMLEVNENPNFRMFAKYVKP